MRRLLVGAAGLVLVAFALPAVGGEFWFEMQEIETKLGVGYAVRLLDMNGDKKLDIAVVDTNRVVWYENPSWKMHTLIEDQTKKDNVCFAPYDIDGDGKIDFALGADWRPSDTVGSGTLQWMKAGKSPADKWEVYPIGQEPTVHRVAWADFDGDGRSELIVVPLFGRGTKGPDYAERPLRILSYKIPKDPVKGPWAPEVIDESLHVSHNFLPTDIDGDGMLDLLTASYEGVSLLTRSADGKWRRELIGAGNQETKPSRGASELKVGRFAGGAKYIATIEPWHGHQVVNYVFDPPFVGRKQQWNRHVIDEQLKWGHAVWCANLDGDKDEELVIGVRDNRDDTTLCGVRIYDPQDASGRNWERTLLDAGGVAVEDLAADDLDGDGQTDIVAVGRATHNVRIYWNR
ncbi:MAG: VCBS repeat-containing protein [Planctomycetia bacterium]|nr:VCBS repeat-containing protein [Planctomycetia bacterium]